MNSSQVCALWGMPTDGILLVGILNHTEMLDVHSGMFQQVIDPRFELSDMTEKGKKTIEHPP